MIFRLGTIMFFFATILVAFGQTEGDLITFERGSEANITGLCVAPNGTACPSSAACTLFVYHGNFTHFTNGSMTYQSGFYNRSLGRMNISGDYPAFMNCTLGDVTGTADATFRVADTLDKRYLSDINATLAGVMSNITGYINPIISETNITINYINRTRWNGTNAADIISNITANRNRLAQLLNNVEVLTQLSKEEIFLITDAVTAQTKAIEYIEQKDFPAAQKELRVAAAGMIALSDKRSGRIEHPVQNYASLFNFAAMLAVAGIGYYIRRRSKNKFVVTNRSRF